MAWGWCGLNRLGAQLCSSQSDQIRGMPLLICSCIYICDLYGSLYLYLNLYLYLYACLYLYLCLGTQLCSSQSNQIWGMPLLICSCICICDLYVSLYLYLHLYLHLCLCLYLYLCLGAQLCSNQSDQIWGSPVHASCDLYDTLNRSPISCLSSLISFKMNRRTRHDRQWQIWEGKEPTKT